MILSCGAPPLYLHLYYVDDPDKWFSCEEYRDKKPQGHRCGDLVLIAAAAELRAAFPDARGIGRVGGDEFAAVFDRPLPAETAMEMGARLAKCRAPLQSWNDMAVFGCSVGICVCSRTSVSCGQFYQEADQALYTSKQQGKARCSFCKIEGGPAVEPETASGSSETSGFRT